MFFKVFDQLILDLLRYIKFFKKKLNITKCSLMLFIPENFNFFEANWVQGTVQKNITRCLHFYSQTF